MVPNLITKARILIVEDEKSMSELLKSWLVQLGYETAAVFDSGESALENVAQISPDLILMDIILKGKLDGIITAKKIQKIIDVPVIFLTGDEKETLFQKAEDSNHWGYLIKPITINELNNAVKFALYKVHRERDFKAAREYTKNIINSSLDYIIAVNNKRKITEFNLAAENAFGYRKPEVLGKHINILYADKNKGLKIHKTTLDNGRCVEIIKNRRKDGSEFPCLLAASIIFDSKGEKVGFMGVSRDITERLEYESLIKESEKKYRNLSEQLSEMSDFRALLIDVIAHDLKNPAGSIRGFSEILAENIPQNEIVKEINNASESLLKIIDNVSALSKMALGEKIEVNKLNLADLVRSAAKEYEPQFRNLNMKLEIDLPVKLWIRANPIIIEITRNYLSNALKYAVSGNKIIIRSEQKMNRIIINVLDFGKTIPKSKSEQIFKRGVQLEGDEAKSGRGLGLAIVTRIAEAHGATVGVRPLKPRGNVFFLSIPK